MNGHDIPIVIINTAMGILHNDQGCNDHGFPVLLKPISVRSILAKTDFY